MPRRLLRATCLVLIAWGIPEGAGAQQAPPAPSPPRQAPARQETTRAPRRPRRVSGPFYKGRPIAPTMPFEGGGAEWLIRQEREQEEQPEAMLDALEIPEGATVADVGAGVGYISLKLARRVGPRGTVLATDLQPRMLQGLAARAKSQGIANVKTIRSTPTDPKLPEGKVDLILMVDVYHEAAQPEILLDRLRKALRPGGRLVLVEYRGEDPNVPIKPEHKMTLAQVRREVEPFGYRFVKSVETLPRQHVIIFETPGGPASPPPATKEEEAPDRAEP